MHACVSLLGGLVARIDVLGVLGLRLLLSLLDTLLRLRLAFLVFASSSAFLTPFFASALVFLVFAPFSAFLTPFWDCLSLPVPFGFSGFSAFSLPLAPGLPLAWPSMHVERGLAKHIVGGFASTQTEMVIPTHEFLCVD